MFSLNLHDEEIARKSRPTFEINQRKLRIDWFIGLEKNEREWTGKMCEDDTQQTRTGQRRKTVTASTMIVIVIIL